MPDDASQIPELPSLPPEDRQTEYTDLSRGLAEVQLDVAKNNLEKERHLLVVARSMLFQRKCYAFALLGLSSVWLWFIGSYLWHFGEVTIANPQVIKPVSDAIIIALITTTTLNVLGLFYIVARWLFPQPPTPKADK